MNKQIIILAQLFLATKQVFVSETDKCDACKQFKSSIDCKIKGCTWTEKTSTTAGSCAPAVDPYVAFCSTVENCSKQRGCALDSGKCVPFPGCSAYAKSSTADCQAISYLCISDGKQCIDVKECSTYSKVECESTPSLYSPFKCKLDGEICRPYKCIEADVTLITDKACDAWLAGCKTTGYGCIDVIPVCSSYAGTATTCPLMKGTDGICDFDQNNNKCKARDCVNAPTTTNTDSDCSKYRSGCVTTGKGCISARNLCSTYSGNATTCIGYIGSDGDCVGDASGTQCRAKKCEDKLATSNTNCDNWKKGCVTNGKGCVASLSGCSSYTGTKSTCVGYIGSDGNCKGTSETTPGACAPKDCTVDAQGTETTDAECQQIQSFCKTTGKGCARTLSLCSSYSFSDDGTSCLSLVGSDGKCKQRSGGKCAVKLCTDAPTTITTNTDCNTFQSGCVTTGAGCVSQQTCTDVSTQATCEGSITNKCAWNAICTANSSCSDFKTRSLCNGYKINNKPCKWDATQVIPCYEAVCTDFKGVSDGACDNQMAGCVSNGTDCLDGTDCSQFKGVKQTCLDFKAKCTNLSSVSDATTPCIPRTCNDDVTFDNDVDCANYLSTCVTKGTGCIDKSSACSAYSGTAAQCDKFTGNGTDRCWNSTNTSGACVVKTCTQATGMRDSSTCDIFLKGCLYDGNGSCVDKSALCTAYTGDATTCLTFTGNDGVDKCSKGVGGKCKVRVCEDNTTATSNSDCCKFLKGCITNGSGCVAPLAQSSKNCVSKKCQDKIDAADNTACVSYHSTCRLQQGGTTCFIAPTDCTGFTNFSGTATDADKQTFCNSVTDTNGNLCSYDSTATTKCAVRACNLWSSTLSVACKDYNGLNSCVLHTNDNQCYTSGSCSTYAIPETIGWLDRKVWCAAIKDNSGTSCIYDPFFDKCADILTQCKQIEPTYPRVASGCNKYLNSGQCQYSRGHCETTVAACTDYVVSFDNCSPLYQYSSGKVTQCYLNYSEQGSGCLAVTKCEDIQDARSQKDCGSLSGCTYYGGRCYTRKTCTAWTTIPSLYTTDDTKRLFCQNMVNDSGTDYCSYGTDACADPKSCSEYGGLIVDTQANIETCLQYRDKTGPICYLDNLSLDTNCSRTSGEMIAILALLQTHWVLNTACIDLDVNGQADVLSYCQSKLGNDGFYCTSDLTDCIVGKNSCADWDSVPATGQLTYCQARIDKYGNNCSWANGSNCGPSTCADLVSPQSQMDCDRKSFGCIYHPQNEKCIAKQVTCDLYTPSGTSNEQKLKYCNTLQSNNGVCTYLKDQTTCVQKGKCSTYNVSTGVTDKIDACQSISTANSEGCTYFGTGNTCIVKVACTSYTGGATGTIAADCSKQTDASSNKCSPAFGTNATSCIAAPANCEAISNATSQAYCDIYVSGCQYNQNQCFTPKADCTYSYSGSTAKSFCGGLKNTKGDKCTAATDTSTACQNRACTDSDAASLSTHLECQNYLSTCKSNGVGCIVAKDSSCEQQSGSTQFCAFALDADNKSTCQGGSDSTEPVVVVIPVSVCEEFDCRQNVSASTDKDCISFNSNCLTKGNGCISNKEPMLVLLRNNYNLCKFHRKQYQMLGHLNFQSCLQRQSMFRQHYSQKLS